MGGFTSMLAAAGIGLQAYGQYRSGQDAYIAGLYNQQIAQQQAQIIDTKKKLTAEQYERKIKHLKGDITVAVASSGYDFSGQFVEVAIDRLTQARLDKQYALYNLEVEKTSALTEGQEEARRGAIAKRSGNIGAIGTLLTEGNEWYSKYGPEPTKPGRT